MGHPVIQNQTPFAFEPLFLADEEGWPLLVSVVKATYSIEPAGQLLLAAEQAPVNLGGEFWGEPGKSSYKYEPEIAFAKPATDVVLIGDAYPRRGGDTEVLVALRLGELRKTIRVVGDRTWIKSLGSIFMSPPDRFERLPLVYERAFGGWDRSLPDPQKHLAEPRNPIGTGFRSRNGSFEEGMKLPNLEDPRVPISKFGDTPPPAGFGFTSPDWRPRADFAGTYDEDWMNQRMPFLPRDFDRRFFNAASAGLTAQGFLKGNEEVLLENVTPEGRLSFQLPGVIPPRCQVELARTTTQRFSTELDTVIINTSERLLFLIWRAGTILKNGPEDVISLKLHIEGARKMATA